MHAILGNCENLRVDAQQCSEVREFTDLITANAKKLLYILNDILDISKIELQQLKLNKSRVNLPALMQELHLLFQNAPERRANVLLRYSIAPLREHHWILTDEVRLKQILSNLLSNALKFTENGEVHFGYDKSATTPEFIFYVKDTGIGIDGDQQELIFESFRQAHQGYVRKFGGTGIGLTISRQLVQLLGGDISVVSVPGNGSKFSFTLPYQEIFRAAELPIREEGTKMNWSHKKFLVVGDDNVSFLLLQKFLNCTGCQVTRASNGQEALSIFSEKPFDLVLMDMQMPIMDGYTASVKLREQNQQVPIIAQTANAMADDRDKCLQAGCNDYISKPYSKENIISVISKYL